MFNIQHSFDHHFVALLDKLEKKYGEEMFELEGIDRKNLDIAKFTNKFLETKVTADVSVDANANVDDTSVLSWDYEMPKPLMKLNGLYFLWKDALKKHGIKRANKMIELDNKYESIMNNTRLIVANNSKIFKFFRKIKSLLSGTSDYNIK